MPRWTAGACSSGSTSTSRWTRVASDGRHSHPRRRCLTIQAAAREGAPPWPSSPISAGRRAGSTRRCRWRPVGERLGELLDAPVAQAPAVIGDEVESMAAGLGKGELMLLENVRFEPGETENDPVLATALAQTWRGLRQRRLWRRASRAREHRGRRSPAAGLRRPAAGERGDAADEGRRVAQPASRRRPRRRQGLRQGRRHRALPRGCRPHPDRRRDVLQLLPRPGHRHGRLVGRGGGGRPGG